MSGQLSRSRCGSLVRQEKRIKVDPGLWSLIKILVFLVRSMTGGKLTFNKADGLITLTVHDQLEFRFSPGSIPMIGLDNSGWLDPTYTGDQFEEFLLNTKTRCAHLE